jgi:RNA recognition motif-containing protein
MERKLFVNNIPYHCTANELLGCLAQYNVTDVKLIMLPQPEGTRINRGYGFVTLSNDSVYDTLLNATDVAFEGRALKFSKYTEQVKYYRIHVSGVPDAMQEKELLDLFAQFGKVLTVKKDRNYSTGQFKGTALVVFGTFEEFKKALDTKTVNAPNAIALHVSKRRNPLKRPSFKGPLSANPPPGGLSQPSVFK